MCGELGAFEGGNKVIVKQLKFISVIGVLLLAQSHHVMAEFGTLFTTASERKTIDENRYKVKKVKKITTVANVIKEEIAEVVYQEITKEYKISGISIANNGIDSVWINNKLWQNGDVMDNKVHIKVNATKQKVRLTVRGGKTFYGQSGDTVIVHYKMPLK